MRIWLINIGEEIPSDPGTPRLLRTGILAGLLAQRGNEVVWWNATFNHQRKEQRATVSEFRDTPEGYRLALLAGRAYGRNISLTRVLSQIENAREFKRLAPGLPRPDAIVCGYPTIELAEAAVGYANARGVPIAVDFRDLWPDVIAEQIPGPLRLAAQPMLAHWRRTLARIVRGATGVIGVTDGFVDWALAAGRRARGPRDRAFHLAINPELPSPAAIREAEVYWDALGIGTDPAVTVACFIGTLSRRLDIGTLLAGALRLSPDEKRRFKLVICGKGDLDHELRAAASGEPSVVFPGWRNAAEIHALLRRCDVGTLPYQSTLDFVRHYPNKVGEYLGAGLPIMTPLKGQVRTLIDGRGVGYLYDERDPESAAACLRRVIAGAADRAQMRARALTAHSELFDSARIYREFGDYVEALAAGGCTSRTAHEAEA